MKPFGRFAKLVIKLTPRPVYNTDWYWPLLRFFQYPKFYIKYLYEAFKDAYFELPPKERDHR